MKNLLIIGDSYSTYENCIPSGYTHYYGKRDRDENHFAENCSALLKTKGALELSSTSEAWLTACELSN